MQVSDSRASLGGRDPMMAKVVKQLVDATKAYEAEKANNTQLQLRVAQLEGELQSSQMSYSSEQKKLQEKETILREVMEERHRLQTELRNAESKISELNRKVSESDMNINQAGRRADQATDAISNLSASKEELQAQIRKLQISLHEETSKLAAKDRELQQSNRDLKEILEDRAYMVADSKRDKELLASAELRIETLQTTIVEKDRQYTETMAAITLARDKALKQCDLLQAELVSKKSLLGNTEAEMGKRDARIKELTEERDWLKHESGQMEALAKLTNQKVVDLESLLAKAQRKAEKDRADVSALTAAKDKLTYQVSVMQEDVAKKTTRMKQLELERQSIINTVEKYLGPFLGTERQLKEATRHLIVRRDKDGGGSGAESYAQTEALFGSGGLSGYATAVSQARIAHPPPNHLSVNTLEDRDNRAPSSLGRRSKSRGGKRGSGEGDFSSAYSPSNPNSPRAAGTGTLSPRGSIEGGYGGLSPRSLLAPGDGTLSPRSSFSGKITPKDDAPLTSFSMGKDGILSSDLDTFLAAVGESLQSAVKSVVSAEKQMSHELQERERQEDATAGGYLQQVMEVQAELEKERAESADLQERLKESERAMAKAHINIDKLNASIAEKSAIIDELKKASTGKVSEAQHQIQSVLNEKVFAEQKLVASGQKVAELKSMLGQSQRVNKRLADRSAQLEALCSSQHQRISSLEHEVELKTWELGSQRIDLQDEMEALKESKQDLEMALANKSCFGGGGAPPPRPPRSKNNSKPPRPVRKIIPEPLIIQHGGAHPTLHNSPTAATLPGYTSESTLSNNGNGHTDYTTSPLKPGLEPYGEGGAGGWDNLDEDIHGLGPLSGRHGQRDDDPFSFDPSAIADAKPESSGYYGMHKSESRALVAMNKSDSRATFGLPKSAVVGPVTNSLLDDPEDIFGFDNPMAAPVGSSASQQMSQNPYPPSGASTGRPSFSSVLPSPAAAPKSAAPTVTVQNKSSGMFGGFKKGAAKETAPAPAQPARPAAFESDEARTKRLLESATSEASQGGSGRTFSDTTLVYLHMQRLQREVMQRFSKQDATLEERDLLVHTLINERRALLDAVAEHEAALKEPVKELADVSTRLNALRGEDIGTNFVEGELDEESAGMLAAAGMTIVLDENDGEIHMQVAENPAKKVIDQWPTWELVNGDAEDTLNSIRRYWQDVERQVGLLASTFQSAETHVHDEFKERAMTEDETTNTYVQQLLDVSTEMEAERQKSAELQQRLDRIAAEKAALENVKALGDFTIEEKEQTLTNLIMERNSLLEDRRLAEEKIHEMELRFGIQDSHNAMNARRLEQTTESLTKMTATNEELTAKIATLEESMRTLEETVVTKDAELSAQAEEIASLAKQRDEWKTVYDVSGTTIGELNETIAKMQTQIDGLSQEKDAALARVDELLKVEIELRARIEDLETQVSDQQQTISSTTQKLEETEATVASLTGEKEGLQQQLVDTERALQLTSNSLADRDSELEAAQMTITLNSSTIESLTAAKLEAEGRLNEVATDRDAKAKALQEELESRAGVLECLRRNEVGAKLTMERLKGAATTLISKNKDEKTKKAEARHAKMEESLTISSTDTHNADRGLIDWTNAEDRNATPRILDSYLATVQDIMTRAILALNEAERYVLEELEDKDNQSNGVLTKIVKQLMDTNGSLEQKNVMVAQLQEQLNQAEKALKEAKVEIERLEDLHVGDSKQTDVMTQKFVKSLLEMREQVEHEQTNVRNLQTQVAEKDRLITAHAAEKEELLVVHEEDQKHCEDVDRELKAALDHSADLEKRLRAATDTVETLTATVKRMTEEATALNKSVATLEARVAEKESHLQESLEVVKKHETEAKATVKKLKDASRSILMRRELNQERSSMARRPSDFDDTVGVGLVDWNSSTVLSTATILDRYLFSVREWMGDAAASLTAAEKQLDQDLAEKDRQNDGMSARLIKQLMELGASLDAERNTVKELQARLGGTDTITQQVTEYRKELAEAKVKLDTTAKTTSSNIEDLQQRLKAAEMQNSSLNSNIAALRSEKDDLVRRLADLDVQLSERTSLLTQTLNTIKKHELESRTTVGKLRDATRGLAAHHELYRPENRPIDGNALEGSTTKMEMVTLLMGEDLKQTPTVLNHYLNGVQEWMNATATALLVAQKHLDFDLAEKDRQNEGMSSRLIKQLMELGATLDAERRTIRELQAKLEDAQKNGGVTTIGMAPIEGAPAERPIRTSHASRRAPSAAAPPVEVPSLELMEYTRALRATLDTVNRYDQDSRATMRRLQEAIKASEGAVAVGTQSKLFEWTGTSNLAETPKVVDEFVRTLVEKLTAVAIVLQELKAGGGVSKADREAADRKAAQVEIEIATLKKRNQALEQEVATARSEVTDSTPVGQVQRELYDQRWRVAQHENRANRLKRSIERHDADAKVVGATLLESVDTILKRVPHLNYKPMDRDTMLNPNRPVDTFMIDVHMWIGDAIKSLSAEQPQHDRLIFNILKLYMGAASGWVTAATSTLQLTAKDLSDSNFVQSQLMLQTLDLTLSEERGDIIKELAQTEVDAADSKPWRRRGKKVKASMVAVESAEKSKAETVVRTGDPEDSAPLSDGELVELTALRVAEQELRTLLGDVVEDTSGLLWVMEKDRKMFLEEVQELLNMGGNFPAGMETIWRNKINDLQTADETLKARAQEFVKDNSKTLIQYFPQQQYWTTDAVKLLRAISSAGSYSYDYNGGGDYGAPPQRAMVVSKAAMPEKQHTTNAHVPSYMRDTVVNSGQSLKKQVSSAGLTAPPTNGQQGGMGMSKMQSVGSFNAAPPQRNTSIGGSGKTPPYMQNKGGAETSPVGNGQLKKRQSGLPVKAPAQNPNTSSLYDQVIGAFNSYDDDEDHQHVESARGDPVVMVPKADRRTSGSTSTRTNYR